jgi:hypothetical protein
LAVKTVLPLFLSGWCHHLARLSDGGIPKRRFRLAAERPRNPAPLPSKRASAGIHKASL